METNDFEFAGGFALGVVLNLVGILIAFCIGRKKVLNGSIFGFIFNTVINIIALIIVFAVVKK